GSAADDHESSAGRLRPRARSRDGGAVMVTIETEDKYGDGVRASKRAHVLIFRGKRYGLVSVMQGAEGRRSYQGPLVPGRWVDAFALASVITANPAHSSGAESQRNRAAGTEHRVDVGDRVQVDGRVFVVAAGHGYQPDYLRLELES